MRISDWSSDVCSSDLETVHAAASATRAATATFGAVIAQIMLLDIVFSLDSIITAVGMVDERWVMVTAIVASIVFMLAFARPIGEFVERHPTVKVLALSFQIGRAHVCTPVTNSHL